MNIFIAVLLSFIMTDVFAETFHVTRVDDPGINTPCSEFSCSLRQAVIAANNNPGADEIVLLPIEHKLRVNGAEDLAVTGDLDITDDLKVTGEFVSNVPLTISSVVADVDFEDRIFDVHPGVRFTMKNVFVHGGKTKSSNGGGFRVIDAALNLENVYVANNNAQHGSGIYADNSQLLLNYVKVVANQNINVAGFGGGLYMRGGQLRIYNSNLSENFSDFGGSIAAVVFADKNSQPAIIIKNTYLGDNGAEKGGAIYLNGKGDDDLSIPNVWVENSEIRSNDAGQGAGIYHQGSMLTLQAVIMRRNRASGNTNSIAGGAIYSGDGEGQNNTAILNIEHSVLFDNRSSNQAAAIYFDGEELNVLNSTISQNEADDYAAMYVNVGEVALQHNSILLNASQNGEDLFLGSEVEAVFQNNIFMARCTITFLTVVKSMGGNIESPGDSCHLDAKTNDLFGSLQRGLLALELKDNGGLTLTHAIVNPLSKAINHGTIIQELPYDQRYFLRDAEADSGAFEWQSIGKDILFKDGFEVGL
ncbi:choice-of-anchor Q domain-containing protein [Marinicella sp. W31]|uniref:choice-of-anchor Q domain-containing protein n=1 Tax=Marinicella sp. W31 TaxID=3023713 RepID=UPI0037572AA9